jgi:chemotaxis protein MotB
MRSHLFAAGALALAACGVSKDEFAAQQRDAQQFRQQYQSEAEKTAALEKKVADQEQQLTAAQQKLTVRDQEIAKLRSDAAKLEEEKGALAAKSAEYEQLTASLKGQIQSGQVEISELRGKMTVKLKDKVLFASGSTALNKEGRAALDAVAEAFKDLRGKNVLVAGYTDDVPTGTRSGFKDNWDLSTARAVTVVRYLQSKGVAPGILGALGFSEYRPLAGNDSTEGRSQNRRIEIALTAGDAAAAAAAPAPAEPAAAGEATPPATPPAAAK